MLSSRQRHRLLEKLGAGGRGEVWRARDTSLDREMAVKSRLRARPATEFGPFGNIEILPWPTLCY